MTLIWIEILKTFILPLKNADRAAFAVALSLILVFPNQFA